MPYSTVAALKTSALWKRIDELHGMAAAKLQKFVNVFDAVYERVLRNGGSINEAESSAIAIALPVARRAATKAFMAGLEENLHYFAPMMPHQLAMDASGNITGQEYSFEMVKNDLSLMKNIASGMAFNWDHNGMHPLGVIRDIILPKDAPADVQAKLDPSTPYLYVASYHTDIPEEARSEDGISSEWAALAVDGKNEVIPQTFAVSHQPLNNTNSGIGKVAAVPKTEENLIKPNTASDEQGDKMSDELKAQVAALTTERDGIKEQMASLTSTVDTANNEVTDLKAAKAALETQVASLTAEAKKAEADKYADGLVAAGRIPTDAATKMASLYIKLGKEAVDEMAALFPKTALGAHAAQGLAAVPTIENDALESKLRKALGMKPKEN